LCAKENIDISKATSSNLRDGDIAALVVISDPPILSLSKIVIDADPAVDSMLVHVEWMSPVHFLSWQLPVLSRIVNVLVPHRVDPALKEVVSGCTLSQSEYSPERVLSG